MFTGRVATVQSCRCVVPYETTVEASMSKRLPAKGNFIDHAHKLL